MLVRSYNQPRVSKTPLMTLTMLILGFILVLLAVQFGPQTQATAKTLTNNTLTMSSTGAVHTYLATDNATISCSGQTVNINLAPSNQLFGQQISFTSPVLLSSLEANSIVSLNAATPLSFSLMDSTGNAYRTFTANTGEIQLNAQQGKFALMLQDNSSQQVFLNANWTCPKL